MARQSTTAQIATLLEKTENIEKTVDKIEQKLEKDYVTQDQHQLTKDRLARVEKVVYGLVALVLIGFATAVVAFFIPLSH